MRRGRVRERERERENGWWQRRELDNARFEKKKTWEGIFSILCAKVGDRCQ